MKFDRHEVYAKYNGKCAYCGEKIAYKDMQVDHIILTVDDVNHIDNLNSSCKVCNKWKSFHHLELFRSEIEIQIKRLNAYSAPYRMANRYGLITENVKPIIFYFEKL